MGDYRFDPRSDSHQVTVNEDLNEYQFLITYVHEVAHRVVHRRGNRQKPHGIEWKSKFRELMLPLLRDDVFPDNILRLLARHMKNPKASVGADPKLAKVLASYDRGSIRRLTLEEVKIEEEFEFRGRQFMKIEKKRTRSVCLDLQNKRRYLIPEMAEVKSSQSYD